MKYDLKNGIINILVEVYTRMSSDLVPKLKPWVTTFSEAIRYNHKHGETLKIGGKVRNVYSIPSMDKDDEDMTYINIDDGVGEMTLLVPERFYKQLKELYQLSEGMIVLAEGRLVDPLGDLKKNHERATIMCWLVEPLPSGG